MKKQEHIESSYKAGIDWKSELTRYQEKANKFDSIISLAKEENLCRSRIKAIAQERAKVLGITEKYKGY